MVAAGLGDQLGIENARSPVRIRRFLEDTPMHAPRGEGRIRLAPFKRIFATVRGLVLASLRGRKGSRDRRLFYLSTERSTVRSSEDENWPGPGTPTSTLDCRSLTSRDNADVSRAWLGCTSAPPKWRNWPQREGTGGAYRWVRCDNGDNGGAGQYLRGRRPLEWVTPADVGYNWCPPTRSS